MDRARPNTCYIQAAPRAHTSRRARKPGIAKTGPAPPGSDRGRGHRSRLVGFQDLGVYGLGLRFSGCGGFALAAGRSLNEHRN